MEWPEVACLNEAHPRLLENPLDNIQCERKCFAG
jgi:hypothetical protein